MGRYASSPLLQNLESCFCILVHAILSCVVVALNISLHNYRAFLRTHGFTEPDPHSPLLPNGEPANPNRLTLGGHALAGLFAGWTNATVAHPTETIKCKLQLQMVQPEHMPKEFSGPIDVVRKTVKAQGVQGMFKGLGASFMYRSSFVAMFGGMFGDLCGQAAKSGRARRNG
jgi:solute carrier family 25 carnitine/acylcarnitine transporter 20/29